MTSAKLFLLLKPITNLSMLLFLKAKSMHACAGLIFFSLIHFLHFFNPFSNLLNFLGSLILLFVNNPCKKIDLA